MEEYISKSVLIAEIENRIEKYILLQQKPEMSDLQEELQYKIDCLNSIKGYIINTLEAKEVQEDSVSEDFEEASNNALNKVLNTHEIVNIRSCMEMFEFGTKWKEEQMMKDAIDVVVRVDAGNYPYIPHIELYDYNKHIPLAKKGDKYKVVLVKEDKQ